MPLAVGATIPTIQLSTLKELEISAASRDEMDRMVHVFEQAAEIQNEIQQLRHKQAALATSFRKM